MGFIVDEVDEVIMIDKENIAPPPKASFDYINEYVVAIGKMREGVVLILDIVKLLTASEIILVQQAR